MEIILDILARHNLTNVLCFEFTYADRRGNRDVRRRRPLKRSGMRVVGPSSVSRDLVVARRQLGKSKTDLAGEKRTRGEETGGRAEEEEHDDGSWAERRRTRGGGAFARKSERRIFWEDQSACGEEAAAGPRAACVPEKVQCPLSDARYQSRRRAGIKRELRQSRRPRDSSRTLPAPDAARADRERERKRRKEGASEIENFVTHMEREILQRKIEKIYAGAECDEKKSEEIR